MAVTVTQQPEEYTPVYNNQIFVASSTQTAQPNFVYTVLVTDLISTEFKTYQIPQRPDGYMIFDASAFAKSYYTDHNYIPINEYGWQQANGVRKIRVNIGETYGTTPVYTPGTDIDYITWNAKVNWLDWPAYEPDDYRYFSATGTNLVFLTPSFNEYTYEDRSNYFYALTSQPGDVLQINIDTYAADGSSISQTVIPNPYEGSSTYTDKYICIDVGHKGLTNIASGDVTGTYPILSDQVAYYTVTERCITGNPPASELTLVRRYDIMREAKHDVYTVHYLSQTGAFETIHFSKRSDNDVIVDKTIAGQIPYVFNAGTYTYSRSSAVTKVISAERTERLRLNTDWLTQEQTESYSEIIDSPVVYLDLGSTDDYPQLRVVTNSYRINKRWNERLWQISIDFEYSHTNHRL